MSNRLLAVLIIMLATTALSYPCFAQTYGTPGYAPGAWKPEELPKDLSQTKKFDPRDLTGVWVVNVDRSNHERHSLTDAPDNGLTNFVPPSLTPWGQEKYAKNIPSYGPRKVMPGLGNDPVSICDPLGYPRTMWEANLRPFEIIQGRDRLIQHMQYHDSWRTVWMDGRKLPTSPDPAWNGYAIGYWDGDTLIVQSNGYDERTWIDHYGSPHSDQMSMVERFRRMGPDQLEWTVTITDPKAYTKPWVMAKPFTFKSAKAAIFEEICAPSEEGHFNDEIRDPAVSKGAR